MIRLAWTTDSEVDIRSGSSSPTVGATYFICFFQSMYKWPDHHRPSALLSPPSANNRYLTVSCWSKLPALHPSRASKASKASKSLIPSEDPSQELRWLVAPTVDLVMRSFWDAVRVDRGDTAAKNARRRWEWEWEIQINKYDLALDRKHAWKSPIWILYPYLQAWRSGHKQECARLQSDMILNRDREPAEKAANRKLMGKVSDYVTSKECAC